MAEFAGRNLSLAARLLALALACKARKAVDGRYYVWRGRKALSMLTGLSMRSVTAARHELVEAGLFVATRRPSIETSDGVFEVAVGVPVLQLVENPAAFVAARDEARARDRQLVDAQTRPIRLEIQKRYLRGLLTREQCEQQETDARRQYRRDRRTG
jgi:hypothetical protein